MHRIPASALVAAIITLLFQFASAFAAEDLPLPTDPAVAELPDAHQFSAKLPYERYLKGEDAKRAEKLQAEAAAADKADDYATTIRISLELLGLRRRVQGSDHWQTTDQFWMLGAYRAIAALAPEKRAAWRQVAVDARKALQLQAPAHDAAALPQTQAYRKQCEEVLGEEHPTTADSYNSVARILNAQGKVAEAQRLAQKALDIHRRTLGEEHPNTATSYDNVAILLAAQGKVAEALPLLQKALDIHQHVLGEEHRDTAASYDSVGFNLNDQGKAAEAQPFFQKALGIRRKVLGEEHPDTATSYNVVGFNLYAQGKAAEAQPLVQKALDIRRKVLGEEHPDTADSYNNVAMNLNAQGKSADAQPLLQKALDINRRVLGEEHPDTARTYFNLSISLDAQGKAAEALPLCQKALNIRRKVLGEEHPDTAGSYNGVAVILGTQGRTTEAQPLLQKALDIRRKRLGEMHTDTTESYNNVAMNLNAQGKTAEALPLLQKALDIRRKVLGEEHPRTAISYLNVASNLRSQGKGTEAEPLFQKALDIHRKVLGEEHPDTASSYSNVAMNLNAQGRAAEAQPLYQKALDIRRKVLGEEHPDTAASYQGVAANLRAQGKASQAEPLARKALDISRRVLGEEHFQTAACYHDVASDLEAQGMAAESELLYRKAADICRKVLGEAHPDTATVYNDLALNLASHGKTAEARDILEQALAFYEASRLAGAQGIDRAALARFNPRLLLSSHQAQSDPLAAWEHRVRTLARGMLDQQAGQSAARLTPTESAAQERCRAEIAGTQKQIQTLVSHLERTLDEERQLEAAVAQCRKASIELAELAVRVSQREVASSADIRTSLPADAAIVFWNDVFDRSEKTQEHWGCVVRTTGDPHWERLRGTGVETSWTKADTELPRKLRDALVGQTASSDEIAALGRSLFAQRLAPLMPHLEGVKTLYVVAVDQMAGVPVELLAPEFTVSYVPSGTFLARAKARAAPVGDRFFALGDPNFEGTAKSRAKAEAATELPSGDLLILQVAPGGGAAQGRLKAGDVIVRYGDVAVTSVEKLGELIAANAEKKSIAVTVWREGEKETFIRDVPPGKLGVTISKEPAREAISNRRKTDAMLASLRGGNWGELPGTRVELTQIAKLFGPERTTTLVDSDASEQSLEEMRKNGDLTKYRYIHFATHGEANQVRAFDSALILAQDKLPKDPLPRAGEPFLNGQLSAREVLDFWKIDAELVTLSACETAVGKSGGGDGQLGFAQAFLTAGARAVCLSLWKVDDTATSLLMTRFYQNLLGKRSGLEKPMGKAAALHEAKQWLRELSSEEALQLAASATNGVVRGSRGKGEELKLALPKPADNAPADAVAANKPFAHPRYWSAFILIGDPN